MNLSIEEYQAILRTDFYSFIERSFGELCPGSGFLGNWHLELIAEALESCRRGETKRLIINVPPRSLKSICCSVAFPAWVLGHNPSAQLICTSYAADLAAKHSMDCRMLMQSSFYQQLFRARLSAQKQSLQEFVTIQKGSRLSTSVGGVLTGRGADFIVVDDPLKPEEAVSETIRKSVNEWFDSTLYSRLNSKANGVIIIVMQRLHEDDLVGHVQRLGDWRVLRLPAIADEEEQYSISSPLRSRTVTRKVGEALHPEREPLTVLQDLRRTLGEYNFAGQYQQSPAPIGGGMVKSEWFGTYKIGEEPEKFDLVFQSWDTANKVSELNDYSVCTTWGAKGKNLFLLNVLRRRLEYPELKRLVVEQAQLYAANVTLVEDRASGTQLIQELKREGGRGVTSYAPKMEKVLRMNSVTATIEGGFVYLPESAPWLKEYLHELTTFPNGKHDDQADSTSQALDWLKNRKREPGVVGFWKLQIREDLLKAGRLAELEEFNRSYPPDT